MLYAPRDDLSLSLYTYFVPLSPIPRHLISSLYPFFSVNHPCGHHHHHHHYRSPLPLLLDLTHTHTHTHARRGGKHYVTLYPSVRPSVRLCLYSTIVMHDITEKTPSPPVLSCHVTHGRKLKKGGGYAYCALCMLHGNVVTLQDP